MVRKVANGVRVKLHTLSENETWQKVRFDLPQGRLMAFLEPATIANGRGMAVFIIPMGVVARFSP